MKLEALIEEYQEVPPRGSSRFMRVLERRVTDLKRRITQIETQKAADELLAKARAAFQPKRYDECADL